MILQHISLYKQEHPYTLTISGGSISSIRPAAELSSFRSPSSHTLYCKQMLALPGFINSHEHPDFNLYPQLGNGPYGNYTQWGQDIHTRHRELIQGIQQIPHSLRIRWGFYKNLLNGFTTVVNHGKPVKEACSFLDIIENMTVLHSTAFERNWKWKLNNPLHKYRTVCMHIGEGTDTMAALETANVPRYNFLRRPLVAVHGVTLTETIARKYKALVWCPASNIFLLGQTAPVHRISRHIPVVLGTDSTLTASWNLWDHLRLAAKTEGITEEQLIPMLTSAPAAVWKTTGPGELKTNTPADLLLIDLQGKPFCEADPEQIMLIIKKGHLVYIDEAFLYQQTQYPLPVTDFDKIRINSRAKFVPAGIINLAEAIKKKYPSVFFPFTYDR